MSGIVSRHLQQWNWRIGRKFVVERVEPDGSPPRRSPLRKLATRFDQALVESGRKAPWVMTADEVREYWGKRAHATEFHHPQRFAYKELRVIDFMVDFWSPEVGPDASVMELGPNAGGLLNHLHELGYEHLSAVEINPQALEEMRRAFPALAEVVTRHTGSFEDVLPTIEDDAVDVVYVTGVLLHVHPHSHSIFKEIVRIARSYICIIEQEDCANTYVFPRNYGRVFRRLGCRELRSALLTPDRVPDVGRYYDGYMARLFATP